MMDTQPERMCTSVSLLRYNRQGHLYGMDTFNFNRQKDGRRQRVLRIPRKEGPLNEHDQSSHKVAETEEP